MKSSRFVEGVARCQAGSLMLLMMVSLGGRCSALEPPGSLARMNFGGLPTDSPRPPTGAAVAFVSNESVAICVFHVVAPEDPQWQKSLGSCELHVIQLSGGNLKLIGTATSSTKFAFGADLGPVAGGLFVGDSLYSTDLQQRKTFPFDIFNVSRGKNLVIGSAKTIGPSRGEWGVYRLPEFDMVRRVDGRALAVSENRLALLQKDTVRVEQIEGKSLGSFVISPECLGASFEFAGAKDLLLKSCGGEELIDFSGMTHAKLKSPDGWSVRRSWSSDGSRILFDNYSRNIPPFQRALEISFTVLTLGLGAANEEPNEESVKVLDVNTGKTCFQWDGALLGSSGAHADISPSGELVSLVTSSALVIYKLPLECDQP